MSITPLNPIPQSLPNEESAEELAVLMAGLNDHSVLTITDPSGRITYCNLKFCELSGYTQNEALGLGLWAGAGSGGQTPVWLNQLWENVRAGRSWHGEVQHRAKDGAEYWLRSIVIPFCGADGKLVKITAIGTITTPPRHFSPADWIADTNPDQKKGQLQALFDIIPAMIWLKDTKNRVLKLNLRAAERLGKTVQEVEGRLASDFQGPETERYYKEDLEVIRTGRALVNQVETVSDEHGAKVYIQVDKHPYYDATGTVAGVVVMAQDITARKQAEEALEASRERFQQVVETMREVFWVYDIELNKIVYLSPSFETIWGRPCEEFYHSPEAWLNSVFTDDRIDLARFNANHPTSEHSNTYRIKRPDGSLRWIHDRSFPVKNQDGKVTRMVGVAEDVTARKDLERQFLRTQRLEAVGTLVGGIAHDLNNILTPVLLVAPLIEKSLIAPREIELLQMMERSARRGISLIRQILIFSRGIEGRREKVQLHALIAEVAEIARATFPRAIRVVEDNTEEHPSILADATQIHQVVLNLCVNARDAMPKGGILFIGVKSAKVGPEGWPGHPEAKEGDYVSIQVRDTGEGIPAGLLLRIFEPFFTTKEVGKGTGLGLSTALGIVRSHGGFITVESETGKGAAFSVFLPIQEHSPGSGSAVPFPPAPGNQELILVVDDEESVRLAIAAVLQRQNYRVLLAAQGSEALDIFRTEIESIKLVITDLMMPHMSGAALVCTLKMESPNLPVVVTSGMHDFAEKEKLADLGIRQILHKPILQDVLLAAIQEALNSEPVKPADGPSSEKPAN